jgi:hypothetical protein
MSAFSFFDLPQNSFDLDHPMTLFRLWYSLSVGPAGLAAPFASPTLLAAIHSTALMQLRVIYLISVSFDHFFIGILFVFIHNMGINDNYFEKTYCAAI